MIELLFIILLMIIILLGWKEILIAICFILFAVLMALFAELFYNMLKC